MIAHWDEAPGRRSETGHIAATWTDLGTAAGSRTVGVRRIEIDPGKWSTPLHRQTAEEEIFYVLSGDGACLVARASFAVAPGDCIVHRPRELHTLRAGDGGLTVLAFGMRVPTEATHLPRAGVSWLGGSWVEAGGGAPPFEREAAAGPPELPDPGERPASVVAESELEGSFGGLVKPLGSAAGAELSGLNLVRLDPGGEGAPPHCHTAEEELFVVLEGAGTLELWPGPQAERRGAGRESHPVRPGHVVCRRPGTGIAHAFLAGEGGLTYLAYGTRLPYDTAFYPRSGKIFFRGLGLVARLEDLDYFDGEPYPGVKEKPG